MSRRKLAVNGQFYPDTQEEIEQYINHFDSVLKKNNVERIEGVNPRAIIVPHAGYIYSGFTANIAYQYIPKDKNIIVIGPSHKFKFDGASVALHEKYPTPLGDLDINLQLSEQLISKYPFLNFNDQVHCEHSTEVQFPFIKHYASDAKVVEIVYSDIDYNNLSHVIYELLQDENNFVVISTDLSHFYTLEEAQAKDNICLEAIIKNDLKIIDNGCEACGITGVKAILKIAKILKYKTSLLDYRTSADASKDKNRVVGYTSVLITAD